MVVANVDDSRVVLDTASDDDAITPSSSSSPEAQPATQGYYLADEPGVHFVWQLNQESSVLVMSRAFDDYYIEDCGVILAPEVTQRRIDNSDQFVILATVRVAFVHACL
ncbi:hypothetical protein ZEAMMB73_Zm00001d046763 [Zea mays]|uniref:protein-serine/threonine phosphatase n=1 Tax=Zea mays TaxID=4577 RepID=A0A1D6P4V8_MAIZE|nr:hypothetical protein ZEAMMB73_Zm00001d046763 [Zea mays]